MLDNRVALILEGTHGFAAATARLLAERRASIAIHYSPGESARLLVNEINQKGGRALGFRADLAMRRDVEKMILDVDSRLGPVDTLVVGTPSPRTVAHFVEMDWDAFQARVQAEIKHAFYAIKAALPGMLSRKRGWIIGLSSSVAESPEFGLSAYAVSKSALAALLKSIALELDPWNIRVHTLSPAMFPGDLRLMRLTPGFVSRNYTWPTTVAESVALEILAKLEESSRPVQLVP